MHMRYIISSRQRINRESSTEKPRHCYKFGNSGGMEESIDDLVRRFVRVCRKLMRPQPYFLT